MDFSLLLQQFLNGLSIGSVYAIFALGYTLVFSILGIINFAQGALVVYPSSGIGILQGETTTRLDPFKSLS